MRIGVWFLVLVTAIFVLGCAQEEAAETTVPDVVVEVDETPPAFGDQAQLKFVAVNESAVVLMWSGATDDTGVSAYHVYKDDIEMAVLAGNLTSLQVHQLDGATEYLFRVEATDEAENMSTDGPSGTIMTGDESAPTWPEDAQLTAADATAAGVKLAWSPAADNVAVTGYRVYQDNLEIAAPNADTQELTVADLGAWRSYAFRVEAQDAVGHLSTGGPTVTIQTGDDTDPAWPADAELAASNITPTTVDLGWTSATDNVEVTHYQVLQDKVQVDLLDSATSWLTVHGLEPWTEYEFEVVALDPAGNVSAAALSVQVQTTDDDTPTWANDSVLLASNPTGPGVTLGWTAAQDNVAVSGYRLYQDNVEIGSFEGGASSAEVSGLQSGIIYLFRVEAQDAAGNLTFGGPTLSVDLSDISPPTWPANAECLATELTPSSVKLGWSAATDNSGIAGYQIWRGEELQKSVPGDQTSATLNDLAPLTEYSFTLVALDSVGNVTTAGPGVSINTPDYPQPSWPLDAELTVGNLTATMLSLSWTAPIDDQPIAWFEIYQNNNKIKTVDGAKESMLVTDLLALTEYSFAIQAVGPTGKVSDDGPATTATTPDYPAPLWPNDVVLTVSKLTETSLTLSWQALDGSQAVASYVVFQDDKPLTTVDADTTSLDVGGLSVGTNYSYLVEAVGPTGLQSTNGPSATATTLDTTAPTWPANAKLTATKVGGTTVELSWTAATDNVGIAGYQVLQNGQEVATVDGQTTTVGLSGLTVSTNYSFKVLAKDGADQWSSDGPSAAVTTTSGQASLTNEQVFEGLKSQCASCHIGISKPFYMVSLGDFNTLLVADEKIITPGDPDGSLLIQLMEGNGPPDEYFDATVMPPSYIGDSFEVASKKGKTDITLEQVRYWIEVMDGN
jgi:chitodextrinase